MNSWRKWLLVGVVVVFGCGKPNPHEEVDPLEGYNVDAIKAGDITDRTAVYTQMGNVSSGPPLSFVARPAFFATPTPDTTLVIVSLSLPNRGLTFLRSGNLFEAAYAVTLKVKQDTTTFKQFSTQDTVRVATLKETQRTDESIIFRQAMRVPPGAYTISYAVRDAGNGREMAKDGVTNVPRFGSESIAQPVVVYEATPRQKLTDVPKYLSAPRASYVFGVNASVPVYLEAYGTQMTTPLSISLRSSDGEVVWRDTTWVAQRQGFAASTINVPLASVDVGVFSIIVTRVKQPSDTARASIFVGFGPDMPVMSFDDMLTYLRFFASPQRVQKLHTAAPDKRGEAWREFLRETDTIPETGQNEALLDYFRRIRDANTLFRFDMNQGWLSDRGMVYVGLGQPDDAYERQGYWTNSGIVTSVTGQTRFLIWEYRDLQARIIFYDQTGGGQWRFVPSSESAFRILLSRRLIR